MASTKIFKDFVLEQLNLLENVTYKPMMGEFLLYCKGIYFGGIFDDRFLIKSTTTNKDLNLKSATPYEGAKPMLLIENLEDKEYLKKVATQTINGLKKINK